MTCALTHQTCYGSLNLCLQISRGASSASAPLLLDSRTWPCPLWSKADSARALDLRHSSLWKALALGTIPFFIVVIETRNQTVSSSVTKNNPQQLTCEQAPGGVMTMERTVIEGGPHTHRLGKQSALGHSPPTQLLPVCWPHHFHVLGKV